MFRKSIIEEYNIWFDKHIAIGEDFLFCFLYGGLWIDSTVILSKRIYALSELFDRLFFQSVLREIVILMFPTKTGQLGS